MMWELLKFTERFQFEDRSKADERITSEWADNELSAEYSQTVSGLERVCEWSFGRDLLDDEDIFISADVDEVMSQDALQQLKWCKTSDSVASGAIWAPMGNLNKALRSPLHVKGKIHTFGLPTIYTLEFVRSGKFDD